MPTQPNLLPVYRHADRLLIIALWAMSGFSLALTGMHDTMKWSLLADRCDRKRRHIPGQQRAHGLAQIVRIFRLDTPGTAQLGLP